MNKFVIENLIVYPIKSFAGIEVESQKALESGFEWDRRWMLIDENNRFISQREHSILALFKVEIDKDKLKISYKNSSLMFDKNQEIGSGLKVEIWKDIVNSFEVSLEANTYFSNLLNQKVKLVKSDVEGQRLKRLDEIPFKTDLNLADGYPYLILGTESIRNLNARIKNPIDYRRFRPNILIRTTSAHEEDNWKNLKIGQVNFNMIKPCVRCNVIGIDQDKGLHYKEPTLELSKYRKENNSIIFGMNAIVINKNIINLNDEVYVN